MTGGEGLNDETENRLSLLEGTLQATQGQVQDTNHLLTQIWTWMNTPMTADPLPNNPDPADILGAPNPPPPFPLNQPLV
jgi:hypothetical protein